MAIFLTEIGGLSATDTEYRAQLSLWSWPLSHESCLTHSILLLIGSPRRERVSCIKGGLMGTSPQKGRAKSGGGISCARTGGLGERSEYTKGLPTPLFLTAGIIMVPVTVEEKRSEKHQTISTILVFTVHTVLSSLSSAIMPRKKSRSASPGDIEKRELQASGVCCH